MSEIDDAADWANATGNFDSKEASNKTRSLQPVAISEKGQDEERKPGQVSQYSLYGGGYKATTSTVKTLPAGTYDIQSDNNGVYVVQTLPPAGIMLELPEMRSEEVIRVVNSFWDSEKDYKEGNEFIRGGAIFKAGVMIYGPGGSGKSTTIKLVSKKLIERGGMVFFSSCHPIVTMGWLDQFARIEKGRKMIVILEDIDSLIENYGEQSYLEMLDSAKTVDNVLFIATTNYPDKLDPRIYNRPGRFSHVIKIGLPSAKTREAYLKAILKNHRDVDYIVEHSEGFTVDHINSLVNSVYREKKNLNTEIKRLRTLFKVPKSGSEQSMGIIPGDED